MRGATLTFGGVLARTGGGADLIDGDRDGETLADAGAETFSGCLVAAGLAWEGDVPVTVSSVFGAVCFIVGAAVELLAVSVFPDFIDATANNAIAQRRTAAKPTIIILPALVFFGSLSDSKSLKRSLANCLVGAALSVLSGNVVSVVFGELLSRNASSILMPAMGSRAILKLFAFIPTDACDTGFGCPPDVPPAIIFKLPDSLELPSAQALTIALLKSCAL